MPALYLGKREINKKNIKKGQSELEERDRYKLVDGVWGPIIDEDLANRVKRRIDFNRESR